eukprot:scaffold243602_cov30-Tisochrysis_lutea.AAC.1
MEKARWRAGAGHRVARPLRAFRRPARTCHGPTAGRRGPNPAWCVPLPRPRPPSPCTQPRCLCAGKAWTMDDANNGRHTP